MTRARRHRLEASAGWPAALRPESLPLVLTGLLVGAWFIAGLLAADTNLRDDLVVVTSPPVLAAAATVSVLVLGPRGLAWKASG